MPQVSDLKLRALRNEASTAVGQIDTLENAWLLSTGAQGAQTQDLWRDYLANIAANPVPLRHINDMFYEWLGLLGYTGALDDRWLQFWGDYGTPPTQFVDFKSRQNFAPFAYTRASVMSDVSDAGIVSQKAIDIAAYYKSLGLVMISTGTNVVANSEDFTTAFWARTNLTIAADTIVSPDGTLNADAHYETVTNGVHQLTTTADLPSVGIGFFSVFIKPINRSFLQLTIGAVTSTFNFLDGSVGSPENSSYMDDIGNGWYRCSLRFNNVGVGIRPIFKFINNVGQPSYVGDTASGFAFWGADQSAIAFQTPYIRTTGVAATRANMRLMRLSNTLPSFTLNNFAMEIEFVMMRRFDEVLSEAAAKIISCRTDANNRFEVEFNPANDQIQIFRNSPAGNGFIATTLGSINYNRGQAIKLFISHTTTDGLKLTVSDFDNYVDASAAAKSNFGAAVPTNFCLGSRDNTASEANVAISYFKYWSTPPLFF